jgi:eukaryotic-like serine/threonine-protein kinase
MRAGEVIQDRFEIERLAGIGGMGEVFRATDRRTGERVAVKVLLDRHSPNDPRFEREAEMIADLDHPGLCRYVHHGAMETGEQFLVMEWLEGEDLRRRLAREPLTPAESLTVIGKAASALAVAHAHGVVHRDIKPSNIFLVDGSVDRVRVLDFGLAGRVDDEASQTPSGALAGTPGYMAPEQARGLPMRDARTDVFSLGCVLFECLTGRRAFVGVNVVAVLAKVQLAAVPSVRRLRPDLPEALDALVGRMMARAPEDRFQDAAEVALAIAGVDDFLAARVPPSIRPITPGEPTWSGDLPTGETPTATLTTSEQRVVSVVFAAGGTEAAQDLAAQEEVERYGGLLRALTDGTLLVTIWGTGSAVDRAARACRCALGLRDRFAGAPVCVVTGRGVVSARVVEGRVIDRGAEALAEAPAGAVRLDAATAEMVGQRFLVAGMEGVDPRPSDADLLLLLGERAQEDLAPLLLGKPTAFVGRGRELALLEASFATAVEEGWAGAVLVTGEPGSGKSRLVRELVDGLRRRRAPVVVLGGRADSMGGGSPYGIIADAIRGAAGIRDGEPLAARRDKLVARLRRRIEGPSLARVSAFLGEMMDTPFPDGTTGPLRAARANAQIMGDAMRAAWEEWLAAECLHDPLVLVLEDLQWGDVATVRLVDATLRNLRDRPLLVLAAARPEVHARFRGLWAARGVHEIKLSPLGRRWSEDLVRGALGEGLAEEVVDRVVDRANGNPFYLEELVRAVAAGRHDTLPDSVLGTVEARLDAEGTDAKRILRAASVFGDRFSAGGVAALLGGERQIAETRVWLDHLATRELVAAPSGGAAWDPKAEAGDAAYVFRSALVREVAYATLTEADRALGHRLAGAWLEAVGSTDAVALAEHFVTGGEPRRAVRWYGRAAQQALAADDFAAAIDRARRGSASGAEGEELGALRLVEAEAHLWLGELSMAEERATEACGLFPAGSEGWFKSLYGVVVPAGKLGHVDQVERSFATARGAAPVEGALNARISCLCACAANLIFAGRYAAADEALDALDATLAAPQSPDPLSLALVHQARSFRASARGDAVACLEGLTATLAAFEQAEDRRNACTTRGNLGFVLGELGDLDGAEEALRAALVAEERMGLHDVAAITRYNLGHTLGFSGPLDEARRLLEESIETFRQQGSQRDEALARTHLAKVELRRGDFAAADREARAAAELARAMPAVRAFALAALARALGAAGRTEEALGAALEAHDELEELGTTEEGEAFVRLVYAEALAGAGRGPELRAAVAEAKRRLLDRAARISDPRRRERFLANIPEHAQTLALSASSLLGL